jgi:hypothetical protein
MANFGNLLEALHKYVQAVIKDPMALQPTQEAQRMVLKDTLDAYIDARIDEKLKSK